jgi:hypothetical protein
MYPARSRAGPAPLADPSFDASRGAGLRAVEPDGSLFWSNRFRRSLTLGCCDLGCPLTAAFGLAELRAIRLSTGDEAERYDVFRFRPGTEGCLGVVPFPFDLNEDGGSRDSGAIVDIPFAVSVYPVEDFCTPL